MTIKINQIIPCVLCFLVAASLPQSIRSEKKQKIDFKVKIISRIEKVGESQWILTFHTNPVKNIFSHTMYRSHDYQCKARYL